MFITNNYASFHLWWKESLVKHQNVSKYYEQYCLKNFILLFMSLLTAWIVKNSDIFAGIYFIFLKINHRSNLKDFRYPIWTSVTRLEKKLWSKKILVFFANYYSLLGQNCVKGLRVPKIWGELEAKQCFQRESCTKYLRQTLGFIWNSILREKFNFYFLSDFC